MYGAISAVRRERQGEEKENSRRKEGLDSHRASVLILGASLMYCTNYSRILTKIFICLEISWETIAKVKTRDGPGLACILLLAIMVRSELLPKLFKRKRCQDLVIVGYCEKS